MRKRLETLERSLLPRRDSAGDRVIVRQALHRLSWEDLMALKAAAVAQQQGKVREFKARELAAIAAYGSALEMECQRAGFNTIVEFERSSGPLN